MNIADYFESLRSRILNDSFILHVDILRERTRSKNGHFRARLIFSDDSTLEYSEYIEQNTEEDIVLVTYSYHGLILPAACYSVGTMPRIFLIYPTFLIISTMAKQGRLHRETL